MFPDRKQIIRIWSTAACAGLLLLSLTQPSLTGAQESTPDGDTASCERVNALLDAALTSTEWAIYPAQTDPSAHALADAALRVGDSQNMLLDRIFTPVRMGRDWLLRVGILDPESYDATQYGYIFLAEDTPYLISVDTQAEGIDTLLATLLTNKDDISNLDSTSYISRSADGWFWSLPADWEASDDASDKDGWLRYEGQSGTIEFSSFAYLDNCAPLSLIDTRQDLLDELDDGAVSASSTRYIGNYRWLILVYTLEANDETWQGRLYLRRQDDRIWAIRAEVPSGTSAGTFFRQLTSSIALIAVD